MIKSFILKIAKYFGYRIARINIFDAVIDQDEKFLKIYNKCEKLGMNTKERMYALYKSVQYIINSKIEGDFVECGVWKGSNPMLIAYTLLEFGVTNRKIYLYDTFEGMSEPTKEDVLVSNKNVHAIDKWKKEQKEDYNKWVYASLNEVKRNVFLTKYPKKNLFLSKERLKKQSQRLFRLKLLY